MYIYKLGTECDGAQMQVSDVYIPTLVALLGLCFDPSECFRDLCIWSRVVGNKSGKLRYVSQIVTECWDSIGPSRNDQKCHFLVRSSQESHDLSGPFHEWLGGHGSPRLHIIVALPELLEWVHFQECSSGQLVMA